LKLAIPRFDEEVAPCFEYSATISIFTFTRNRIINQTDFSLSSKEPMDRLRLLRDQNVNVLICSGIQASFQMLLESKKVKVISWITGKVDEVIKKFIKGELQGGNDDGHSKR